MLQIAPNSTIYFASSHIDFRKGIDGIVALCRKQLGVEPLDGAFFLFYNRTKTTIKILSYDGQGFWLCTKRLSTGTFKWDKNPDSALNNRSSNKTLSAKIICHKILHILINNGSGATFVKDWRSLVAT